MSSVSNPGKRVPLNLGFHREVASGTTLGDKEECLGTAQVRFADAGTL